MKGSGLTPLNSSKKELRCYMKLSLFNTSMGTHKQCRAYMRYEQYESMQDIRERDSGSIANTKICFEVRSTALRPRFTQKDFHYTSTEDFPHREPPLRIWVIQTWSTQLLSQTNTTSIQEERHNNNHLYT